MCKSIILLAIAATISLLGWQQTMASEHDYEKTYNMPLFGAWSKISVDEAVMDAAYFAANILDDGQLKTVLSAESQIVAGVNYSIVLEMDNEHQWEVIVYQHWSDAYQLVIKQRLNQDRVEPYL